MRKKVLKFYAGKGFHLSKLIDRRPPALNSAQVEAAAVKVFNLIQKGEIIKDINIARKIFEIAKTIRYQEFVKDHNTLEHYKEIIKKLTTQRYLAYIVALCGLVACATALFRLYQQGGF